MHCLPRHVWYCSHTIHL